MKPPTISEDEEAEAAAEAGADTPQAFSGGTASDPETADKEVADWVRSAIKRKLSGEMGKSEKPALHAAPLDAVPGSPLLDRGGLKLDTSSTTVPEQSQRITGADAESEAAAAAVADAAAIADPEPRDGVTIESPVLITQKVHSMDFADGVGQGSESNESESKGGLEAQAPSIR
jgi:hypothetical protein